MKWPKLSQPKLPDGELKDPKALVDAASKAVGEIAAHPDTALDVMPHDLARQEADALRRGSPRRLRWREIDKLEVRAAALDQRAQEASANLQRLHGERQIAPDRDARRLADWIAAGEKGKRPEPLGPELDRQIEQAERERDAFQQAAGDVLEKKFRYVERNRKRLIAEADERVDKAARQYEELIEQLAAKRAELADVRYDAVWASIYPARAASAAPPDTIVGGNRKTLERASVTAQVRPEALCELLRADAAYLEASVTEEQAKELGLEREGEAVWAGTERGRRAERKEKQDALARHRREWGREPV